MALARLASLSLLPTSTGAQDNMALRTALAAAALASMRVFAAQYEILVGDPGAEPNSTAAMAFVPDLVNATRGDTISFVFAAPWSNHRVVQGRRARPCAPETGGFDSGWRPVGGDGSGNTTFNIVVKTSAPIWFICLQPDGADGRAHCIDGMVGAVNAAPASLAAFRDSATRLTALPPSLTSTKATPSSSPSPSASGEKREGQSKIAVGVTLAFIFFFVMLLWCWCKMQARKLRRALLPFPEQPVQLLVTTHTSPPFEGATHTHAGTTRTQFTTTTTHMSVSSPWSGRGPWRPDGVTFVFRETSEVANAPLRPPPQASLRPQRNAEEPDLPRYEDTRADVLLDGAAPAPVSVPAPAQDGPPPVYTRS